MKRSIICAALCLGLSQAATAAASSFSLSFQSEAGDWIGQGQNATLTSSDVALYEPDAFDSNGDGLVDYVRFVSQGVGPTFFILDVGTANFFNLNPENLDPGFYADAQRASFAEAGHPGLDFTFDHRGSNTLTGNFTVLEAVFSGLTIERFNVVFEQHSEGAAPALFGSFEYDAHPTDVPEPATLLLLGPGIVLALRRIARKQENP